MATTARIQIRFVDSKTGSQLANTKVWIDGKQQLASEGLVVYDVDPSKPAVWGWIEADGYRKKSFSVSKSTATVQVEPDTTVLAYDLTVQIFPQPMSGVELTVTGGELQAPVTKMTSVGTATFPSLAAGTYHVKASMLSYKDVEQDVTIPDDRNLGLRMELDEAGGEAALTEEAEEGENADDEISFDSLVAAAAPPKMDSETFEEIYGNSAFESYYTSAQARVYIGNLFIDEMQSIQFAGQANVVPLYGYASRLADAFADGKSLVQGQLVLNYVSPAYLFTVLDEYQRNLGTSDVTAALKDGQDLAKLLEARQAIVASGKTIWSLEEQIASYASTPAAVREAKKRLRGKGFDPVFVNPLYLRIPFDLTIEIGADKASASYRRLEACRFTSNEQIFDQSGNVIGDAFGFIARRVR